MDRKGGYILINLPGLDLAKTDAQTIAGATAEGAKVINTDKPVILTGIVNASAPVTPIPAYASYDTTNKVLSFMIAGAMITVEASNKVTVISTVPSNG